MTNRIDCGKITAVFERAVYIASQVVQGSMEAAELSFCDSHPRVSRCSGAPTSVMAHAITERRGGTQLRDLVRARDPTPRILSNIRFCKDTYKEEDYT